MKIKQAWILLGFGAFATASCGTALVVGTGTVVTRTILEERTTMDALKDAEIQLSLNNRFLNHSGRLFHNVSTTVIEGRVLLLGNVPKRADKITASKLAWATPGVRQVSDELKVSEGAGVIGYAEDAWISSQLRLGLLADGRVASQNYNVETVGKVVHVTGIARSPKELKRVLERAARIPGVARVVSHVLTIDDPRRKKRMLASAAG